MHPPIAVVIMLCVIPVACIAVWIALHYSKKHLEFKCAMSQAYYRRARQGIPNRTNFELGPLRELIPYRYSKKNKKLVWVRPRKEERERRARMHSQGIDFHVIRHGVGGNGRSGSIKQHHQGGQGSHWQQQQQSKQRAKKQKQKQKQKRKQNQKQQQEQQEHQKNQWNQSHSKADNKSETLNRWMNNEPAHHSNRGSQAGNQSQKHDQGYQNPWPEEPQAHQGSDGVGRWHENAYNSRPASQHGAASMPGSWNPNFDNQSQHHGSQRSQRSNFNNAGW